MKKYPFVKQEDYKDCGAASLLMIIKYYKGFISLEHLKEMLHVTRNGITAYDIVNTATKIGFNAKCYKVGFNDFSNNDIVLPCIANVVIDGRYKHYIVINEINYSKKYLIISDPASKIKKISFLDFEKIYNNYLIILYPQKTIPIIDNEKIDINYFLKIIFSDKCIIKNIIILSFFITFFSIFSSFYIEYIINALNNSNSFSNLTIIFLIFLFMNILKNTSEFFRSKILVIVNQKLDLFLTLDTYYNILSLPYHYYRNRTTGDIISRVNDLGTVKDSLSKTIILIIVDLPLTIISLLFLLIINQTLFQIALIILIIYIFIIAFFRKTIEEKIYDLQHEKSNINSEMVEAISGFETVKGLKIKKYIFNKFEEKYIKYLEKVYKFQNHYLIQDYLKNITNDIGFVVITFVGSTLVLKGQISFGSLLSFNALIIYFLGPIKNIISFDIEKSQVKCSLKRIYELNQKNKEDEASNTKLKGEIEYKNVSYAFDLNKSILKNINVKINAGEKVLLLGPSGSGKSTMLKMLMNYYKVGRNKIEIDGIDINDLKNSSYIKYINQIETLFTDTLYNNLVLGSNVDQNKINNVIEICGLNEIVNKDSLGLNQIIEENGFNLSGGERQRIVLARTLLMDFDILIIDEGLNQVDIDLEKTILKNMMNYFKDKTIIVISHRVNNMELYNRVFNMHNGVLEYE